jgi:hypothetical protein
MNSKAACQCNGQGTNTRDTCMEETENRLGNIRKESSTAHFSFSNSSSCDQI